MSKAKQFQTVQTDRRNAQPMPHRTRGLLDFKGFSGQLPKNRANQIVSEFIATVQAPKDARMNKGLMHAGRGSPCTADGFKPTDSKKNVTTLKSFLNMAEPIWLENYSIKMNSQTDLEFLFQLVLEILVACFGLPKNS